jgi:SAM-dependent methyltransferase
MTDMIDASHTLPSNVGTHNAQIFFSPKLAQYYAGEPLSKAETALFGRHRNAIEGKRVLDLGVGSGRTTPALLPISADYRGCDLAPPMLDLARVRFPQATFIERDIRDLTGIEGAPFDFILASCNLFDALPHEERMQVLRDVHALLTPGGMLIFSAHNRCWKKAGSGPQFALPSHPYAAVRRIVGHAIDLRNFRRMRAFEQVHGDHAMLRDISHRWLGVFYYTDRDNQEHQLRSIGYEVREVVGLNGEALAPGADTRDEASLHYVCVKQGCTLA